MAPKGVVSGGVVTEQKAKVDPPKHAMCVRCRSMDIPPFGSKEKNQYHAAPCRSKFNETPNVDRC